MPLLEELHRSPSFGLDSNDYYRTLWHHQFQIWWSRSRRYFVLFPIKIFRKDKIIVTQLRQRKTQVRFVCIIQSAFVLFLSSLLSKRSLTGKRNTPKIFVLHYHQTIFILANLVEKFFKMFTAYHAIMFSVLLIGGAGVIFQASSGKESLANNPILVKAIESKFYLNTY